MRHDDPPITLGLSKPGKEQLPSVEELQFQRAHPLHTDVGETSANRSCVACKQSIADEYYHAQGQVVCPLCAERIQSGQQKPPTTSLFRAALYGAGAALAGCAIYALVAIATGLEVGLIAILVGIMVGKSIRHASHGLGGRPQQILAVALTYFAITTSYIPVFIYHIAKDGKPAAQADKSQGQTQVPQAETKSKMSPGTAILYLLALTMAAPFLGLFTGSNPIGNLISLFIIYIGLQRAWVLTGRPDIFVIGPYKLSAP